MPIGVDALELPRDAGSARHTGSRIVMINLAWPERIVFGQSGRILRSGRQTGI